jgi:predicted DNA-binding transcriptional regulator AlpA
MSSPVPFNRPDLKDSEPAYHCAASISGAVARAGWFSTYARMKDGHLPRPGSWGEQSHRWCQGIDVIDAEVKRYESEMIEESKNKAAKKRG